MMYNFLYDICVNLKLLAVTEDVSVVPNLHTTLPITLTITRTGYPNLH